VRTLPSPIPVPEAVSHRVLHALQRRTMLWRFLREFCRSVERAGGSAYLVGGIVRDLIEGRPGNDVDLMVTGIGFEALGKLVRALPRRELGIRRVVAAGRQFAVYKVSTAWTDAPIDVALARSEHSTGPGHRQFEVRTRGVDAREDASRRDFTINSLMFSFRGKGRRLAGEVIDFFGGMEDLRRRRIRGVGNPQARIREDPLRMLRAIRQKNERPGTVIERRTWQAIRRDAKELIGTISGERLVGELAKSLAANPSSTVSDLHRAGILPELIPGIPERGGTAALSRMKKRYALLERSLGRPLPETVLFANLLADVARDEARLLAREAGHGSPHGRRDSSRGTFGRNACRLPRTEALARKLHLPRVRKVIQMVEDLSRLSHLRLQRNPHARIEAVFGRWERPDHLQAFYTASRRAASEAVLDFRPVLETARMRPHLLSGDDILALGVPAGPLVESILEEVREATLTGRISGGEEAKRLAAFLLGNERLPARNHRGRTSRRRVSSSPARARKRTKSPGIR
jgi:tRNA nucleotidyltransferase/poly(A) polymerase